MTLFQKLWTAIRSGFWSKPSEVPLSPFEKAQMREDWSRLRTVFGEGGNVRVKDHGNPMDWKWINDPFYESAASKNLRLAEIAFQRDHLKEKLATAKRQKTKRRHIYAALATLTEEEMRIEAGK